MKKVQGLTVSEREGLRALLKEHSDVAMAIWGVLVCYVTRLMQEMPCPSISQPAGCPSIKEDQKYQYIDRTSMHFKSKIFSDCISG